MFGTKLCFIFLIGVVLVHARPQGGATATTEGKQENAAPPSGGEAGGKSDNKAGGKTADGSGGKSDSKDDDSFEATLLQLVPHFGGGNADDDIAKNSFESGFKTGVEAIEDLFRKFGA